MTGRLACACLLAVVLVSGVAAAANQAPTAAAGMDQSVAAGTTVYLDAGGSTDPDGTLDAYRWSITTPDGNTTTPDCPTCAETAFTPNETGRYEVQVAVTDDDGATATDTLYVTVEAPRGPLLSVTGPNQTVVGSEASYVVDVNATDAPLSRLVWLNNGTQTQSRSLAGDNATVSINQSFPDSNPTQIDVLARDEDGYTTRESLTVSVRDASGSTPDVCGYILIYAPDVSDTTQDCSEVFTGRDILYRIDGEETWVDVDGDGEITKTTQEETDDVDELESVEEEISDTIQQQEDNESQLEVEDDIHAASENISSAEETSEENNNSQEPSEEGDDIDEEYEDTQTLVPPHLNNGIAEEARRRMN